MTNEQIIELINNDEDSSFYFRERGPLTLQQTIITPHPVIPHLVGVRRKVADDIWDDFWVVDTRSREVIEARDQSPKEDELPAFPPAVTIQEDEQGTFWKYSEPHDDEIIWRRTNLSGDGPDGRETTQLKAGDVVYPIIFHANDRGGWTVSTADGSIEEYWQAN